MKIILSLIIGGALAVSGFGQTRNVLVGTNSAVVQPTNFWSADASNARTGLGLGTAATNPASAFQPSSTVLSNLSSSNGSNLTNIPLAGVVGALSTNGNGAGLTNLTASNITGTIAISNGGSGATTAGGARTNFGLGWSALTNTNAATSLLGYNTTNFSIVYSGGQSLVWTSPVGVIFSNEITFRDSSGNAVSASGAGITFGSTNPNPIASVFAFEDEGANALKAIARTNLGLGWSALTNSNAATFQAALFGTNTNPVLVNTNGSVVSPTNFWAVAPISTTVQYQTNVTGTSTNAATNSRNLFLFSLSPSVSGITNTVTLPTNPAATFEGDRATIIHLAQTTNAVTAIRQLGAATNLITLNQLDEAVLLMYRSGAWMLADNISYIEPIFFSGTNAAANAATTRTNLGLGATWLTNGNVTNFRTAIGLGDTNDVTFKKLFVVGDYVGTPPPSSGSFAQFGGAMDVYTNYIQASVPVYFDQAATTRTNLGLGATWLTNTSVTNFRSAIGLGETNSVTFSALTLSSDLNFGGGDNIVLSTTNGTKIGTATNQLLGFYNQTPIVQPSSTGVTTNGFTQGGGNNVHPASTFTGGIGTNAYTISDIVAHLKSLGLIAP
jgi:hypothetical protein